MQHQHSPRLAALQYQWWEGLSTRLPGLRWGYISLLQTITLASTAQKIAFYETKGNIITSYLGGALGVMAGIYTAGGISGAHMNPAFSLAMCLIEQFPWWKFPIFVVVQTLGSFISAGAVYILYYGMGEQHPTREPHISPWLWEARLMYMLCLCPQMPSGTIAMGPLLSPAPKKLPPSLPLTLLTLCLWPMASWTR